MRLKHEYFSKTYGKKGIKFSCTLEKSYYFRRILLQICYNSMIKVSNSETSKHSDSDISNWQGNAKKNSSVKIIFFHIMNIRENENCEGRNVLLKNIFSYLFSDFEQNRFRILAKKLRQGCQKGILRVQKKVVKKKVYFEKKFGFWR